MKNRRPPVWRSLTEGQGGAAIVPPPGGKGGHQPGGKLKSYADLSPGTWWSTSTTGGRYVGMVKMPADGIEKDYVKIAYAGTDVLYVPATQLDLVSKYIGGGENADGHRRKPRLAGGTDWERAKTKAKKAGGEDGQKGLIQLAPSASCQALPSLRTPRGSGSLEDSSSTRETVTSSGASPRRRTWSALRLWTGCSAAT